MRLALHSVSYAGVWPGQVRLGLDSILDKAVRFGYQGVMLVAKRPHASVLDLDGAARRDLRAAIRDRGLELAALAGYTDFCAGHDRPDVPLREMQILYVTELARLAHDLGGNLVRIFTGFARPGVAYDTLWGWCVDAIRECAARAAVQVEDGGVRALGHQHDALVAEPHRLVQDGIEAQAHLPRPDPGVAHRVQREPHSSSSPRISVLRSPAGGPPQGPC